MKRIKNFRIDQIPAWKIVLVATSDPDYEMDRTMYIEDYPDWGDATIVSGFHCSCFDFDDTEWEAIQYTSEQLVKLAKGWEMNGYGSEKIIAPLILRQLQ